MNTVGAKLVLKINWATLNDAPPFIRDTAAGLKEALGKATISADERAACSTGDCTYVWWGCGSCGDGAARVDVYCGSGGSEPDYSYCEAC